MHGDKGVYLERATWPSPDGRADARPPGPLIDGTHRGAGREARSTAVDILKKPGLILLLNKGYPGDERAVPGHFLRRRAVRQPERRGTAPRPVERLGRRADQGPGEGSERPARVPAGPRHRADGSRPCRAPGGPRRGRTHRRDEPDRPAGSGSGTASGRRGVDRHDRRLAPGAPAHGAPPSEHRIERVPGQLDPSLPPARARRSRLRDHRTAQLRPAQEHGLASDPGGAVGPALPGRPRGRRDRPPPRGRSPSFAWTEMPGPARSSPASSRTGPSGPRSCSRWTPRRRS